jgi:hypothetical protein
LSRETLDTLFLLFVPESMLIWFQLKDLVTTGSPGALARITGAKLLLTI